MVQQNKPDDFVIATGQQNSVHEFVVWAAEALGIAPASTCWVRGARCGRSSRSQFSAAAKPGGTIVRLDSRYFRTAEVDTCLIAKVAGFGARLAFDRKKPEGAPRKLLDISCLAGLGWQPSIGLAEASAQTCR